MRPRQRTHRSLRFTVHNQVRVAQHSRDAGREGGRWCVERRNRRGNSEAQDGRRATGEGCGVGRPTGGGRRGAVLPPAICLGTGKLKKKSMQMPWCVRHCCSFACAAPRRVQGESVFACRLLHAQASPPFRARTCCSSRGRARPPATPRAAEGRGGAWRAGGARGAGRACHLVIGVRDEHLLRLGLPVGAHGACHQPVGGSRRQSLQTQLPTRRGAATACLRESPPTQRHAPRPSS